MKMKMLLTSLLLFSSLASYVCQTPNCTVSLDGTGDFTSLQDAITAAPMNNPATFTIYIKSGKYNGPFTVDQGKINLMLVGDGIGVTIIDSGRSNSTGYSIKNSAAMNVLADDFTAKYITFVNHAGPDAGQAVALRTAGSFLAFQGCAIEGYQDTLFTDSGMSQFFYDCHIYGTVDFIFGDAKVIIQNSYIYTRKRTQSWSDVITAQGRKNPSVPTATILHNCSLTTAPEYDYNVKSYLGRPWMDYSRTIVMESFLDSHIDPEGWSKFDGKENQNTLYYAEYKNRGPGSPTGDRIKWPGFHVLNNPEEVIMFTVEQFIDGSTWLPKVEVPYIGGLIQ